MQNFFSAISISSHYILHSFSSLPVNLWKSTENFGKGQWKNAKLVFLKVFWGFWEFQPSWISIFPPHFSGTRWVQLPHPLGWGFLPALFHSRLAGPHPGGTQENLPHLLLHWTTPARAPPPLHRPSLNSERPLVKTPTWLAGLTFFLIIKNMVFFKEHLRNIFFWNGKKWNFVKNANFQKNLKKACFFLETTRRPPFSQSKWWKTAFFLNLSLVDIIGANAHVQIFAPATDFFALHTIFLHFWAFYLHFISKNFLCISKMSALHPKS